MRSCMVCGAVLPEPVHANRKFCEPCAKKRIARYKASWWLAKKMKTVGPHDDGRGRAP